MCVNGRWTVQRQQQHSFASIACDQAIEQTVNRDTKTTGGLRGISLNRSLFCIFVAKLILKIGIICMVYTFSTRYTVAQII